MVGQSLSLISTHEKFSPCRPSAGALIEGARRHSSHLIAILAMEISENSPKPICLQNYWGRGQIWCIFSPTAGISFLKTKMLFRKSMNWHWMTSVEDLFKGACEWKVDWVLLRMLFRQMKKKLFGNWHCRWSISNFANYMVTLATFVVGCLLISLQQTTE